MAQNLSAPEQTHFFNLFCSFGTTALVQSPAGLTLEVFVE